MIASIRALGPKDALVALVQTLGPRAALVALVLAAAFFHSDSFEKHSVAMHAKGNELEQIQHATCRGTKKQRGQGGRTCDYRLHWFGPCGLEAALVALVRALGSRAALVALVRALGPGPHWLHWLHRFRPWALGHIG